MVWILAALLLSPILPGLTQRADALLIRGARILDPQGEKLLEGQAILIEEGKIRKVGPAAELAPPPGAKVLDLGGLVVVPGLIDLHTHLLLHPYDEAPWETQVLKEALELRTLRAVPAARATLRAGFTTIRDLGSEGAGFADVALRDAIRGGLVEGPRIFASTRALVASFSYGPSGFDPRWDVPRGAQQVTGPDAMRRAVRQQIAAGADWIKVYADYRRTPGARSTPTFTVEEMHAAVLEARSAGLPVSAHASTAEGIRRAVLAGVRTIEHGSEADEAALKLMREHEVTLCPTLAASEAMARYAGWKPGQPEPERMRADRLLIARALKIGVSIACGSDAGVFAHGQNAREIELMAEYGMGPAGALRSATIEAARVLDRGQELGRIAPGFTADLIAVRGNPLGDPRALENPVLVLKEGRVVADRREQPSGKEREAILAFCRKFLEEYSAGRFDAVEAMVLSNATVTVDWVDSGVHSLVSFPSFLAGARAPGREERTFREWFSGEPRVALDHDLAMVWAPYALESAKGRESGVDLFQLLRTPKGWRIASLAFTNRGD